MKHTVDHPLEAEKARQLLERALNTYVEDYAQYSMETGWKDEATAQVGFQVTGTRVDGEIKVCEGRYEIDLDLPWVLRPFKKEIVKSIDREFARWISSA